MAQNSMTGTYICIISYMINVRVGYRNICGSYITQTRCQPEPDTDFWL